ncbi:MAG TPA: oligoribonuclease [Arenicellales bacterium]|uniref:Exonuclease domain-containing protein n=1 Tax=marine metagenome TaxID=408172 RepID=A0A381WTD7_9ZZZZ|nr:oligoribonuclease [Acidiferrobacteraceae bacterium]HJP10128.1 oligoribonuclease [Arenicellales bacterium]|tara:strand:+ start:16561 stop:17118 length:558 start_codon:yes stop_codon:yes gene_type:complete
MESGNLVWMDLEMTGLEPDKDRILEMATIVTDAQLNIVEEGPVLAIHQVESALLGMDEWNQTVHSASGLIDRVRDSTLDESAAEQMTLEFLRRTVVEGRSPLCGNSICQDRRFLYRYMPLLTRYLHYRNVDVSTIKELMVRWCPERLKGFEKKGSHRALDDIRESIEELKFYRKVFVRLEAAGSG